MGVIIFFINVFVFVIVVLASEKLEPASMTGDFPGDYKFVMNP
jgi:hypothetical protein